MTLFPTLLIAFAMSSDAFAAAISKGASLTRPRFSEALRIGAIFGFIEAMTPLIGWALGTAAEPYVQAWDHWIAFAILCGLGGHMIWNGCKKETDEEDISPRTRHSFWLLAATGFATSIDAMAIGVTLAFVDNNILITAAAIGAATLLMVTLGVMVGRMLGAVIGKRAEIIGGIALVGIGSLILYEHMWGMAG
ncbi:MAG: manganese efflux pump MntP [Alcaligenaceae bacterium]|nr:manganese efflux pump MntP [Alcaligenaceae bacterium]